MQRGVKIEWDLKSIPLEVKTNSVLGEDDEVVLNFVSADGQISGQVHLYFLTTLQYSLYHCTPRTNLPVTPPSADDKVWRITLTKTAGVRLVIHCNDMEVLNRLISDGTCIDSRWSTAWNRDVAKMMFRSYDTASDYYRPQSGD